MRSGPLAAISLAILLAIGVALAAAIGSADASAPAISKVTYIRYVDHGQPARLRDCPLLQWITVEEDGALLSVWYLQRRQNGLCMPINDFEDGSRASEPAAPHVAARSSLRLTSNQRDSLRSAIARLRWQRQWGTIEDLAFPPTVSPGCDLHLADSDSGVGNDDQRLLIVESADNLAAALSFLGAQDAQRAGQACEAVQTRNIAMIDSAFAPYVTLMPAKMTLPPNLSELLAPKNLYLTD
jgi:hypothetical protein